MVEMKSNKKELSKEGEKEDVSATAVEIYEAPLEEEKIVQDILTQWYQGGTFLISSLTA